MKVSSLTAQSPAGYDANNATGSVAKRKSISARMQDSGFRYNIHPLETGAGLVDANLTFGFDVGDMRRYGVKADNATDDTAALTNCFKLAGVINGVPGGTSLTNTGAFQLLAGTVIHGNGMTLKVTVGGVHGYKLANSCTIRDHGFTQSAGTNVGYLGLVYGTGVTGCVVEDCFFSLANWAAILLQTSSNRNTIRSNYITDGQTGVAGVTGGIVQDACAIAVLNGSSFNTIEDNHCYGAAHSHHGILVQDTYNTPAQTPKKNDVCNNDIQNYLAYGIAFYFPGQATTGGVPFVAGGTIVGGSAYTAGTYLNVPLTGGLGAGATANITVAGGVVTAVLIVNIGTTLTYALGDVLSAAAANIGGTGSGFTYTINQPVTPDTSGNRCRFNKVQDIAGNIPIGAGANSGAGIYNVGAACGGVLCYGNQVENACTATTTPNNLAPAGISFSGVYGASIDPSVTAAVAAPVDPIIVAKNKIRNMTQYHGFYFVNVYCGVEFAANVVNHPIANNGANAGEPLFLQNVGGFDSVGFRVEQNGNKQAVLITALDKHNVDISLTGGIVNAYGGASPITVNTVGTSLLNKNFNLTGGMYKTTSNTPNGGSFNWLSGGSMVGVTIQAGSQVVFLFANCTNYVAEANQVIGTGAVKLQINGSASTNAGFLWGRSNRGITNTSQVVNNGFGAIYELYMSTAPASGTVAVGDNVQNSAPAAAGIYFNIVTTAGVVGSTAVVKTISNT